MSIIRGLRFRVHLGATKGDHTRIYKAIYRSYIRLSRGLERGYIGLLWQITQGFWEYLAQFRDAHCQWRGRQPVTVSSAVSGEMDARLHGSLTEQEAKHSTERVIILISGNPQKISFFGKTPNIGDFSQ